MGQRTPSPRGWEENHKKSWDDGDDVDQRFQLVIRISLAHPLYV
jgi:hypothetical protein